MRNTVRKFLGAALIAMVGVFVLAPAIAGAQTTDSTVVPGEGAPPSPGFCSVTVTPAQLPNPVPAGGVPLTIAGTAPAGVQIQVFYNQPFGSDNKPVNPGVTPVATTTAAADGTYSVVGPNVTGATDVSANYTFGNKNFYATGCANGAGEVVTRVTLAGENVARPLAFTGSDSTPTFVIIGGIAVVVGLVLVVAARRRSRVNA